MTSVSVKSKYSKLESMNLVFPTEAVNLRAVIAVLFEKIGTEFLPQTLIF